MDQTFTIRQLDEASFAPLFQAHVASVFADDHSYQLSDILSREELQAQDALSERIAKRVQLYFAAFDADDSFIGWSFGAQENKYTFYMINSAVLPHRRRQGVYTALMSAMVDAATTGGFQVIYSRHTATNNAIIIPKLKAGFVISKLEVSDVHGVLVHLHHYPNKTRLKVLDYRVGERAPDEEVKRLFGL